MFDTSTRRWTVRDLMRAAIDFLGRRGVDEARLTVELLLAHALKRQRISLYTDHDLPLGEGELSVFRSLIRRRLSGEPVQYIVEESSFMGMAFNVDSRVLVPRPETETVVEQVIMHVREHFSGRSCEVLDVGTGSGNIAVACAKLLPEIHATGVDNSEPALRVASSNARRHAVEERVRFQEWDMRHDPPAEWHRRFDVVVSNPPYIPLAEWELLDPLVRDNEPQRALTDGGNGFAYFERLGTLAPTLLKSSGPLIVEVADLQAEEVMRIMRRCGAERVSVAADLSRVPRVVTGHFSIGHLQ